MVSARTAAPSIARPRRARTPEDFFDPEAHALLQQLFRDRAARWQADHEPPIYFYPRYSAPLWGAQARMRWSSNTIRASHRLLCDRLCIDLERGLRLLTLTWTEQNATTEGDHNVEEWRAALAGVLWRVGQLYREFTRRKGAAAARRILTLAMDALWGVADERLRRS